MGTPLLTPSGSTITTPKQALIDTNVLVALVDTRDTWHANAQAVREALKTTAVSLVYCDTVLNEAISVLARRAQEQRRADQFAGLVHTLLHEVPTDIIVWLSSETQRLYDQVVIPAKAGIQETRAMGTGCPPTRA